MQDINIKEPSFFCPIHGAIPLEETLTVHWFDSPLNGVYCMRCILGPILKKLPKLERYDRSRFLNRSVAADFELFWAVYPLHKSKERARKVFFKLKPKDELMGKILIALEEQKQEKELQSKTNQFCPPWKLPATWLNGKCWEDEVNLVAPKIETSAVDEIRNLAKQELTDDAVQSRSAPDGD